jgi:nucleotide-binding universal stress UspA family protein
MFKTIALAVDGSDHALKAVPVAAEIARLANGKVIVLHVREHDRSRGQAWELETEEEANAVVKHAVAEVEKNDAPAEGFVIRTLHGKVAQALIDSAREHGTDAIVMGSRGLTDVEGMVLGSVSHKVIHLSDKPVIIAR